jgi:hypothetical protein
LMESLNPHWRKLWRRLTVMRAKRIDDSSARTLLSHLVAHTQGTFDCSKFPSIIRSCWYQIAKFWKMRYTFHSLLFMFMFVFHGFVFLAGRFIGCRKRYGKLCKSKLQVMFLIHGKLYQTSGTLTFAMYMLTQRPHITRWLREEIFRTVGNGRPTFGHLRAFIKGTLCMSQVCTTDQHVVNKKLLRLYPAVYAIWSLQQSVYAHPILRYAPLLSLWSP